jgi:hypothetical protein
MRIQVHLLLISVLSPIHTIMRWKATVVTQHRVLCAIHTGTPRSAASPLYTANTHRPLRYYFTNQFET